MLSSLEGFNSEKRKHGLVFNNWLTRINKKSAHQKRKIILLLDNFSSHTVTVPFTYIEVIFYPPNCTSVIQPVDQGIIANFKHAYRSKIVQEIIERTEQYEYNEIEITIKGAIDRIFIAWDKVKTSTITRCFQKAGHNLKRVGHNYESSIEQLSIDPELWKKVSSEESTYRDYLEVDFTTESHISDAERVSTI